MYLLEKLNNWLNVTIKFNELKAQSEIVEAKPTYFCHQWNLPLLAIRENTDLRHFCIGFKTAKPSACYKCPLGLEQQFDEAHSCSPLQPHYVKWT